MEFCAIESCGKCTPCRIGSTRGVEVIDKITAGEDREANLELLSDLCQTMTDGSLCAMGGLTPMPVMSAIKQFQKANGMPETGAFNDELVNKVYAVSGKGAPPAGDNGASPAPSITPPRLAICVLPFANMSGDNEQEYFSDGISEDIITDLNKVSALFVVARNTAFTFKGKNIDLPQVARQLKVNYVLEGSVRRAGGRVRITAQLIEAASDNHSMISARRLAWRVSPWPFSQLRK